FVDQPESRVDVGAADDHDVVLFATFVGAPGPCRTATGVTGCPAGGQDDATELDLVAVLQDAVHLARLPAAGRVQVLALAAGGDDLVVAAHDIHLGPGQLLQ